MKYEGKFTSRFKKDFKLLKKRNLDLERLYTVIGILADGMPFARKNSTIIRLPEITREPENVISDLIGS